jgi:hypothetical protein
MERRWESNSRPSVGKLPADRSRTRESWLRIPDTSITFGMALTSSVNVDGLPNRYSSKRMRSLSLGVLPLNSFWATSTGSSFSNTASRNPADRAFCSVYLFSYLLFSPFGHVPLPSTVDTAHVRSVVRATGPDTSHRLPSPSEEDGTEAPDRVAQRECAAHLIPSGELKFATYERN